MKEAAVGLADVVSSTDVVVKEEHGVPVQEESVRVPSIDHQALANVNLSLEILPKDQCTNGFNSLPPCASTSLPVRLVGAVQGVHNLGGSTSETALHFCGIELQSRLKARERYEAVVPFHASWEAKQWDEVLSNERAERNEHIVSSTSVVGQATQHPYLTLVEECMENPNLEGQHDPTLTEAAAVEVRCFLPPSFALNICQ